MFENRDACAFRQLFAHSGLRVQAHWEDAFAKLLTDYPLCVVELQKNHSGQIPQNTLGPNSFQFICRVQFPTYNCARCMFQDRDASAFRQLFANSGLHVKVHWEDAWNACCPLIVKLQEAIQLLLHGSRVVTDLFGIVRRVLRCDPKDMTGSIISVLCLFHGAQQHCVILWLVVLVNVRRM